MFIRVACEVFLMQMVAVTNCLLQYGVGANMTSLEEIFLAILCISIMLSSIVQNKMTK